jgi:hypothetical protein
LTPCAAPKRQLFHDGAQPQAGLWRALALASLTTPVYVRNIVSQHPHNSPRAWREIARDLAREPDGLKRRALMEELNKSSDPTFATCAICNKLCELTSCKIDEQGRPVHENCYTLKLKSVPNRYS